MYAQVEKPKENSFPTNRQESRADANFVAQKKDNAKQSFGFVDNRPETVTQRKLQEMIVDRSVKRLRALPSGLGPVQRHAIVVPTQRDGSVVITAEGEASDFQGGDEAKNKGWNGVAKYKADAWIKKRYVATTGGNLTNDYKVAQAGHILAQQNGGLGSNPDNVFAQDGGMNNSTYRKKFENPMREALGNSEDTDKVYFRAVLYGEDITQGTLSKEVDDLYASDEDTDFEMEESVYREDVEIDTANYEYNGNSHNVQGMIDGVLDLVTLDEEERERIADAFNSNDKMEDALYDISHVLLQNQMAIVQQNLPGIYGDNMR